MSDCKHDMPYGNCCPFPEAEGWLLIRVGSRELQRLTDMAMKMDMSLQDMCKAWLIGNLTDEEYNHHD